MNGYTCLAMFLAALRSQEEILGGEAARGGLLKRFAKGRCERRAREQAVHERMS